MAGHSHSANIRFRKDRVDAARGKLFSRLAREIMSAAKEGGGDPAANLRLRYAIDRARGSSMPRDNIERAVKKGCGEIEGEQLEEILYEGYAAGGVAVLVESLTDNRNRTAPELRKIFEKRGGKLGASGTVAWMFERKGVFVLERAEAPGEDDMMEIVLDVDAEDLMTTPEAYEVRAAPESFRAVAKALEDKGLQFAEAKLSWIPSSTIEVTEKDKASSVLALMQDLDDHDDVQSVSANYDIPDALLVEIGG